MRELELSTQFKKGLKRLSKQRAPLDELNAAIMILQNDVPIPEKYKDHLLIGNWKEYREIHITPDLLLIYKKTDTSLRLSAAGTHAELFGK